ncbi:sulfite oxidase [Mesobacillus foraminis]|uniref:sulfite oxidase n=1 Tax=Mesobacillus foraminis TaxID=279826 RepID=UPI0039A0B3B2
MNSHRSWVQPFLTTKSLLPKNQESPIEFIESDKVDSRLFYRRNHFLYPVFPFNSYWLPISGAVTRSKLFSLDDLLRFPSKTIKTVLECAGNKRRLFNPKVFGEQWGKGALSQADWKGVPLRMLLESAGIKEGAKEVVVEGYDYGPRSDLDQVCLYARSLPLEKAMDPDTIIAYEFNGRPIPFQHGYPLRLIAPQWYAMASVKWIKYITVMDSEFSGPFQSIDYVYYPHKDNEKDARPVTEMNVNSTIQNPQDMDILNAGTYLINGIAWTGKGRITMVEVSLDKGHTWKQAEIQRHGSTEYSWVRWSYKWTAAERGEYRIMSRASDSFNRKQPSEPFWNRKGYGYNAIDHIKVKIE